MSKEAQVVAIIPARGGSKGVPRKNLRVVGGVPLVGRAVDVARNSSRVDAVYVSSDDDEILAVSEKHGALPIRRPADLSGDAASSEAALLHGIEQIRSSGLNPSILVFIQCTTPFLTSSDVDRLVEAVDSPGVAAALTVSPHHSFIWRRDAEGFLAGINHNEREPRHLRQELPPEFRENGAAYAMQVDSFLRVKSRFCGPIVPVETEIPPVEIDEESDLALVETLLNRSRGEAAAETAESLKKKVATLKARIRRQLQLTADENRGLAQIIADLEDSRGHLYLEIENANHQMMQMKEKHHALVDYALKTASRLEQLGNRLVFRFVRKRLQNWAATLRKHAEGSSPTSANDCIPRTAASTPPSAEFTKTQEKQEIDVAAPRPSNVFLDRQRPDNAALLKTWKKISSQEANERWRASRRAVFLESGEYARIAGLKDIHRGSRCFLIGNGPSLARQNLSLLSGEVTFVSNWFVNAENYAELNPRYYCVSSYEMFGGWNKPAPCLNATFYDLMQKKAKDTVKFFSFNFRDYIRDAALFRDETLYYPLFERPKRLIDEAGEANLDLSRHLDDGYTVIQTFCIPLAVHMGCTEIILIGCDCDYGIQQESDSKKYFYDSTLHKTSTTKFESLQRIWSPNGPLFRSYQILARELDDRGVRLLNATDGGLLDVLPRVDYNSLF